MTLRLFSAVTATLLALGIAGSAQAQPERTAPVFDTWLVDCASTGACFSSSFTRNQSVWVDLRIVRDWRADAQPLLRLTTNTVLPQTGTLRFDVDGTTIESLPIEQLREIQAAVTSPPGFRPLGGEGFWYPTGAVTSTLLTALQTGQELTVHMPREGSAETVSVSIPLQGLKSGLLWLDNRKTGQERPRPLSRPDLSLRSTHRMRFPFWLRRSSQPKFPRFGTPTACVLRSTRPFLPA